MAVRVEGLSGLVRDFRKLEKTLAREVQGRLKKVAEPVVQSSRAKVGRWRGSKPSQIRPRVRGSSVYVTQHARKVTGRRGDFGSLQMRKALAPALEENESEVERGLEDVLDDLANRNGF